MLIIKSWSKTLFHIALNLVRVPGCLGSTFGIITAKKSSNNSLELFLSKSKLWFCDFCQISKNGAPDFAYFTDFYLIETIRSWGRAGEMDFFWRLWKSHFCQFWYEKFCDFKNFFSCELPMVYTIMVHNRFHFHPSNTWSWAALCLGGQNHCFQA